MTDSSSASQWASIVEVDLKDAPIYCPNPNMVHWSAHPRVFIDVLQGQGSCPYCGTQYRLRSDSISE